MTEDQDSDQPDPAQQPEIRARRERIEHAVATLRALSGFDLVDVLLRELDWRRLDEYGNPNRPHGLYEAATTAMIALVGAFDDDAMAERLAAVGRGVPLGQDTGAALIREIAGMVEAMRQTDRFPAADRAAILTKTLSQRLGGRDISVTEIQAALDAPTLNGRITKVVLAMKIESRSERQALDRVKAALK